MDASDYVLEGERVALGPLRKDLADTYRRWVNDLDVRNGILNPGLYALEAEEAWVEDAIAESAGRHPKQAGFTIYDRGDGSPVGTCGLHGIDWRYSRATFGIAIGAGRGRGLGTEATRLVLDYAFHELGLRNVLLETLDWNAAGLAAYERAGFRRIGVRRSARISRGRPTDVVLMDAVPQDLGAPVPR
jgi:diamine N-acetyltransferase